jgi:hypothetical protein
MEPALDPSAHAELSRVLQPGESLLWADRPGQGLRLRPMDAIHIPFSIVWGGFAIFWETMVVTMGAPLWFAIWGVPFVMIGLYLMIGRFFVDARLRARTVYGLTNRRVVVVFGHFGRNTVSVPLSTLTGVSLRERRDGSGTLHLGNNAGLYRWGMTQWPDPSAIPVVRLELIPDARRVYDEILKAQRAAT